MAKMATAMAMLMGVHGESDDVPPEVFHGLLIEQELNFTTEPGAVIVAASEVRSSTGRDAEQWRVATDREFVENFVQRNVHRVTTEADKKRHGPPLPMKVVYTIKARVV